MPGLTSYAAGFRVDGDETRWVVTSTWDTLDQLAHETGGHLSRPATPLLEHMTEDGAEHYELVSEPSTIHVATPEAVVRIARMTIDRGEEESFYAVVRRGLESIRARERLLAYHLGRRIEHERHVAAAVSVWRSSAALEEVVEPETGEPLWADEIRPLLTSFEVEHFDAILPARPTFRS
jgi:quinol monooxygenase YgiN